MNDCKAKLPNGIEVGMSIEKSKEIDKTLSYDDFDEVYLSSNGYCLKSNHKTNNVLSIQVFVKKLMMKISSCAIGRLNTSDILLLVKKYK